MREVNLPEPSNKPALKAVPNPDEEREDDEEEVEPAAAKAQPARRRLAPVRNVARAGSRDLRRAFYEHELAANFEVDLLERNFDATTEDAGSAWAAVQSAHIDELIDQIEDAGGDLETLAEIEAAPNGSDVIIAWLLSAAQAAAYGAAGELLAQGATGIETPILTKTIHLWVRPMRDGRAQATGLVSFKVALAWVMLIGSLGATPPCMWAWYAGEDQRGADGRSHAAAFAARAVVQRGDHTVRGVADHMAECRWLHVPSGSVHMLWLRCCGQRVGRVRPCTLLRAGWLCRLR